MKKRKQKKQKFTLESFPARSCKARYCETREVITGDRSNLSPDSGYCTKCATEMLNEQIIIERDILEAAHVKYG